MALSFSLVAPRAHAASKGKIYMLTSTYGVMAGALTGFASLAFYKHPGDHMRNVAVGASLGLYTGILLGAYLIYWKPDPNAPRPAQPVDDETARTRWYPTFDLTPEHPQVGVALTY